MTTQFKAKPPSAIGWRSIPRHLKQSVQSFAYSLWQAIVPFKSRPEEIAVFPEPDPDIKVTEAHVKQCQWIFDQVEGRRAHLEQKAQSTFSLMLFLVPLLASLFILIISKGAALTKFPYTFTLVLIILSALSLLLAFIAALRAIAVKGSETLFLDSVIHESGQFRKYRESFHARGLLYCASMNTAINDHIAQFVKGAHFMSAAAVVTLLLATIPTIQLFSTPPSPIQAQILGPVSLASPDLIAIRADIVGIRSDIQNLSVGKAPEDAIKMLGDKIGKIESKLAELQKANNSGGDVKATRSTRRH